MRIRISLAVIFVALVSQAFADPFGYEMGMSLSQVAAESSSPPDRVTGGLHLYNLKPWFNGFESWNVAGSIDPKLGLFWIAANSYSDEFTKFDDAFIAGIVSKISAIYGKPSQAKENEWTWKLASKSSGNTTLNRVNFSVEKSDSADIPSWVFLRYWTPLADKLLGPDGSPPPY